MAMFKCKKENQRSMCKFAILENGIQLHEYHFLMAKSQMHEALGFNLLSMLSSFRLDIGP